jgi:hypothetical protein
LHVVWDQIRQLIINPRTQEPITNATLNRYFKRELAAGGAMLKRLAASKYFEASRDGEAWAVRMAMRNRFGWVVEGSTPVPAETLGPAPDQNIQITFVVPSKQQEPVEISPPAASGTPDYSLPAIEGPRPRARTPFGAVWEQPTKDGWMGE